MKKFIFIKNFTFALFVSLSLAAFCASTAAFSLAVTAAAALAALRSWRSCSTVFLGAGTSPASVPAPSSSLTSWIGGTWKFKKFKRKILKIWKITIKFFGTYFLCCGRLCAIASHWWCLLLHGWATRAMGFASSGSPCLIWTLKNFDPLVNLYWNFKK